MSKVREPAPPTMPGVVFAQSLRVGDRFLRWNPRTKQYDLIAVKEVWRTDSLVRIVPWNGKRFTLGCYHRVQVQR